MKDRAAGIIRISPTEKKELDFMEGKNYTYGMMGKKGFDAKKARVDGAPETKSCWQM